MHISIDNNGIGLVDAQPRRLRADPDANQSHPRGSYVYAHLDQDGNIFYVGKEVSQIRSHAPDRGVAVSLHKA